MGTLLDTDPNFQQLKSRFGLTQQAQSKVLPALQEAENITTVANAQLTENMAVTQAQIEEANKTTSQALNNIERIDTYPKFVGKVLGLFDPDWNKKVQGDQLNKAQHQINAASTNLKLSEAARNMVVQEALQRADTVEKFYTFTRQGFLDTASMINMGFETERNIRQRELDLAVDADIETLRMWSEDISKAPKGLQDKPGLIGTELSRKILAAQQGQINQINLDANSRRRWLNEIADNSQLEAYAQNPASLPDYVKPQDVIDELARRTEMGLNLDQLQVNVAANRRDLAEKQRTTILDSMNSFELQYLVQSMDEENKRSIEFKGAVYSRAELNRRLSTAIEEETKTGLDLAQTAALEAELAGTLSAMEDTATNIARLYTPGKENPDYSDLPPHLRRQFQISNSRLNALAADGRLKTPEGLPVLKAEADKQLAATEKAIETLVTQYPKQEQPAVREFAHTGAVAQPTVAADYLYSAGDNLSLGTYSPTFNPVFQAMSTELTKVKQEATSSFSIKGTEITSIESKDPASVTAVQQAITRSGSKEIAKNVGVQYVLHNSFADLIREAPQPGPQEKGGPASSVWSKIYDPLTGRFVPEAYRKTQDGGTTLDLAQLNILLASETIKLRDAGALPANLTLTDILFSKSTKYSQEYGKTFDKDITAAAFKTAAYGPTGSPARDVHMAMRIMVETTTQALQAATSNQNLANDIQSVQTSQQRLPRQLKGPPANKEFQQLLPPNLR